MTNYIKHVFYKNVIFGEDCRIEVKVIFKENNINKKHIYSFLQNQFLKAFSDAHHDREKGYLKKLEEKKLYKFINKIK